MNYLKKAVLMLLVINFFFACSGALAVSQAPFNHIIIEKDYIAHSRAVADVDGDGKNDIIANNISNFVDKKKTADSVVWYKYPSYTRHIISNLNDFQDYQVYGGDDMRVADIDGDGDVDVIGRIQKRGKYIDPDGVLCWWENPLGKADPASVRWQRHDIGKIGYLKDVAAADINGDGKLDAIARGHKIIYIFIQKDAGSWQSLPEIHVPKKEGMVVGDIDNDGDIDLICNGYWLENPTWKQYDIDKKWYNQHDGVWQDNCCNVAAGDIDKDGKIDVLYSHSEKKGYPISWYSAKDPKKGPWIEHKIEAQFDFCQTLDVGDINKDGKEDVFAARFSRHDNAFPPPFPIVVYYNTGKGAGWVRQELADSAMYHGILGDLGSDGDLDIVGVKSYYTGPAEIWENRLESAAKKMFGF